MSTTKSLLPARWKWLADENAPRLLVEALKLYGTLEAPGAADNPQILAWADEVSGSGNTSGSWYDRDSIPWCGLFLAVLAVRAAKPVPHEYLRAKAWLTFGRRAARPELGNVMIFSRGDPNGPSGHVGLYVGETDHFYYVLGGNQSDSVCITRQAKHRLIESRVFWRTRAPANVRPIYVDRDFGQISENEA